VVYYVSAVAMLHAGRHPAFQAAGALAPHTRLSYGALLASMAHLALHSRVLQRRALYQAGMFGAFSLFWTTTPLLLASPAFGLTQNGIALFALAGAAGAIASPIAGRLADRDLSRIASTMAMLCGIVAFLISHFASRWLGAGAGALDRGRDHSGFRGNDQSGGRPAGDLRDQPGTSQPPQRPVHGDILRRRRLGFSHRRLGLRNWRLDA
jgi:hypothetical protein